MSRIYHADSFGAKEYDRAIATGTLGTMVFWGKDRKSLENLRARIIQVANQKGRQHIIETTLIDENHISITYLGSLKKNPQ